MISRAAVLLVLPCLLCGTAAHADPKSESLVRDFVAWVDSSPDWSASVSDVRSEGNQTVAEGLVFSRDNPRISISIEELRLTDLVARDGGGFAASAIEVKSGEAVTTSVDAKMPAATLSDASLPSLADVTIDPRHMMQTIARFYTIAAGGTLGEMKVPEISVAMRQPDSDVEAQATYRNILLTGYSGGVLAHEEAGPISFTTTGSEGELSQSVDKAEADRIDLGAMAHILDRTQYRDGHGDNLWRPLASHIAYHGMAGRIAPDTSVRIKELAVENIDGRQPEEPFTSQWDQILDPEVPQDAKNDVALDAMTGMFGAFRVGTIRLDGMTMEAPEEKGELSLDGITLSGLSSAGFDSLLLKSLNFESPEAYFSLGAVEVAGFVSPDTKALMQFAAIEKGIDLQRHAEAIQRTFAALPRLSHFGVEALVAGKSQADSVSLGRFSLDFKNWNKIFAEATDLSIEDLKVPRSLLDIEPEAAEVFDTLGYDVLAIGASLSDRWDPVAGTDQATWSVKMADAGDVELSYTLTGLTMDWLMRATAAAAEAANSEAAMQRMLNDLIIANAKLTVTDRSLMDRAFAVAAKKQGITLDGPAYREQMRAALPFIVSAVIPAELAQRFVPPLQSFMAGGQTLSADIAPPTPLALMDIATLASDPLSLPDRLGLKLQSAETQQ